MKSEGFDHLVNPHTVLYSSSSNFHLSVLMASLSTLGHSADSNSDTLSTYSEDSHNSQDMNSSQNSDDLEEDIALMELNEAQEIMPELVDMDVRLFDEDDSDESDKSDNDLGNDADEEEAWVDEVLESYCGPSVVKQVCKYIEDMYSTRYEEPHDKPVPCPLAQMPHVLKILKVKRPDHF